MSGAPGAGAAGADGGAAGAGAAEADGGTAGAGTAGADDGGAGAVAAHEVQMRWRDLDGLGHVNHTVVLTYLEEGRDAFLRGHGIRREEYVVGRCAVTYRDEIDPDLGTVEVHCALVEMGNSSLTTAQRITDRSGRVLVEAEFGLVLWDPGERAPRRISDSERASLRGSGTELRGSGTEG
ncbi:MAG: thioesterase family protein [Solirubrobacterales bacterium]